MKLTPLTDDEWPQSLEDMRTGFAGVLNVYRTMAHHPALLRAWSDLREHVVNDSALGEQGSEVVILRTGFRLGSDYEWSHHVVRARRCGMSDARIDSIRGAPDDMADEDALLCKAVDELFEHRRMAPATLTRLAQNAGKEAALDLIATVGFYATLGYILNSSNTPLDADIASELAKNPLSA